jgi:hypothetical protein
MGAERRGPAIQRYGSYAERIAAEPRQLARKPANLDWNQAAGLTLVEMSGPSGDGFREQCGLDPRVLCGPQRVELVPWAAGLSAGSCAGVLRQDTTLRRSR